MRPSHLSRSRLLLEVVALVALASCAQGSDGVGPDAPDTSLQVTGITPAKDTVNVGIDTPVTVTFNRAIDPASLDATTLAVRNAAGSQVPGAITYDAATRKATFVPKVPFAEFGDKHTVTVSGVRTPTGTAMVGSTQSSFTTVFVDGAYWYRLHNARLGPNFALDNYGGGHRGCYLGTADANTTGSYWTIEPIGSTGTYSMKSMFGGPDLALEAADGVEPCLLTTLAATGYFSGQVWSFVPFGPSYPGGYRLQSQSWHSDRSLEASNTGVFPESAYMAVTGSSDGQVWYLTHMFRKGSIGLGAPSGQSPDPI